MHSRLLLTFDKEDAGDPKDAIEVAEDLLDSNSFCYQNDGGYWSGGVCDYYEIGGRWSGELNDPVVQKIGEANGRKIPQEENARIVDKEIWERLIKPYEESKKGLSSTELIDLSDCDIITDRKSLIGKKWIVVVDYHV